MQYKKLGRAGIKISEIGLGCYSLGGHVDESTAIGILNAALDRGITLFDTADVYHKCRSEEVLGKAIKSWQRHKIVIETKVRGPTADDPNGVGLSRKHIIDSVEKSLRRLQTDYIDIYLCHYPDPDTPIDETLMAMDDIVRAGKVRYIGCSNFAAWEICKALWVSSEHNLARFDCVQVRYNLVTRAVEQEVFPLCASEGIGILVYNALAGGLLTGKYKMEGPPPKGSRLSQPDMVEKYRTRYWYDRNFEAVEKLRKIAQEYGHTLPQIASAWVLQNKAVSCTIIGVTSIDQLTQNLSALDISMSPEETMSANQIWESMLPPGWSLQMGGDVPI